MNKDALPVQDRDKTKTQLVEELARVRQELLDLRKTAQESMRRPYSFSRQLPLQFTDAIPKAESHSSTSPRRTLPAIRQTNCWEHSSGIGLSLAPRRKCYLPI